MFTAPHASTTHRIDPFDPALRYRGAVSLQPTADGVAPWRVPFTEHDLYLPTGRVGRAAMTAGVRVTFRTTSSWLRCRYTATEPPALIGPQEKVMVDIVCDGVLVTTITLQAGTSTFAVDGLGPHNKTVEIWLPCYSQFRLGYLEVGAPITRDMAEAPRWVHYGSSISQGRGAASPSRTWVARVGQAASLDLTSVAIGAGCHLQPLFGMLIRDLPADLVTCCVGINNYAGASLNEHSFRPNLIGFLRLVRERYRGPLVVMSTIYAPSRENSSHTGTLTLQGFREETRLAVEALRRHGDTGLHYLNGLDVFGPDQAGWFLESPDEEQLHLNPGGHEIMADRFRKCLAELDVLHLSGAR